jgi:hypothetical protein
MTSVASFSVILLLLPLFAVAHGRSNDTETDSFMSASVAAVGAAAASSSESTGHSCCFGGTAASSTVSSSSTQPADLGFVCDVKSSASLLGQLSAAALRSGYWVSESRSSFSCFCARSLSSATRAALTNAHLLFSGEFRNFSVEVPAVIPDPGPHVSARTDRSDQPTWLFDRSVHVRTHSTFHCATRTSCADCSFIRVLCASGRRPSWPARRRCSSSADLSMLRSLTLRRCMRGVCMLGFALCTRNFSHCLSSSSQGPLPVMVAAIVAQSMRVAAYLALRGQQPSLRCHRSGSRLGV